jgi:aquaporin Z
MNKLIVEYLGTLFLMFIILSTGNYLAIGSALAIAILLGGAISGGSFNPAVTIALWAAGKLSASDILPYIVAEIAGALSAFQLLKFIRV